ncbi:MAG: sigma-70 family RNA polymerase sigma factor [Chitinophagaceae bacterium]|nr:sigma-70 family RNA polymerase sigma factor [Chitinophagaceae bacterium]MCW5904843.1 sigma-70 family RNA polymerase sigma factor [Chitinophagaceae bacterium]
MNVNLSEQLSETDIIKRIVENGEKSLYEIIIRRFNPYLYKIGRSYNYNHEDTQDLMQDTFIDAYKHLSKFEGRADFKTWIVRIMMNNCYRKKEKLSFKNEKIMQDVHEQSKPLFVSQNNTGKVVHNKELGSIIEDALSKIPNDYRITFSLREINGFSVAETADLLNITESNVKIRLNRAKSMLRDELTKSYSYKELYEFNLIYCDAIVENVMKKINEL